MPKHKQYIFTTLNQLAAWYAKQPTRLHTNASGRIIKKTASATPTGGMWVIQPEGAYLYVEDLTRHYPVRIVKRGSLRR